MEDRRNNHEDTQHVFELEGAGGAGGCGNRGLRDQPAPGIGSIAAATAGGLSALDAVYDEEYGRRPAGYRQWTVYLPDASTGAFRSAGKVPQMRHGAGANCAANGCSRRRHPGGSGDAAADAIAEPQGRASGPGATG